MNRTQVAQGGNRAGVRTSAVIRPAGPGDLAPLSEFFANLSVESRYLRFFAPVIPSHGLLDLLSGGPAHVDAIVAVADGVVVGHAMAVDRPDPGDCRADRATDVGVVVADAWQRRGVGAALMRALIARAQARGITSLGMDVLPVNRRVLAMVIGHWPEAAVEHSPDSLDIRIPLPPYRPGQPPARAVSERVRPLVSVGG